MNVYVAVLSVCPSGPSIGIKNFELYKEAQQWVGMREKLHERVGERRGWGVGERRGWGDFKN